MATANSFTTENIRNVVVLGHGGAGKSTLVDAVCYSSGTSKRQGQVDDGTALTMTTPEEISHGMSMQVTLGHAVWNGTKINLLDTPGYMDFIGDTAAGVRVADAALVVVSAVSGVEVGTESAWRMASDRQLPAMVFVSMMDKKNADFGSSFQQIRKLIPSAIPVEVPIGSGSGFRGIVNLFSRRAHIFEPETSTGEYVEEDIPEEVSVEYDRWETELMETLATTNEDLLDQYLEGGEITREEAVEAMGLAVARGDLVPVFCGAAAKSFGVRAVFRKIVELFPDPGQSGPIHGLTETGEDVVLHPSDEETMALLVFKATAEPHVGEVSMFRVFSGALSNGEELRNVARGTNERLTHLSIPQGKNRLEVSMLHAGDIGVVAKLKTTHTNDVLSSPSRPVTVSGVRFPHPAISVAVKGVTRTDEDKLGEMLNRLQEEDPTFVAAFNPELHQTIARGLGELHLDVQFERLKRKYGVSTETEQPRIAYRETITAHAEGRGRFKKQSGGRGQFGDCWIRLRPRIRGDGYGFINAIKGGVIPTKYLPSVERGIKEAAMKGVVAGFPLMDFEAECYDGSYHAVDSSDIAFKIAGSSAFRAVAKKARPVLLEPIMVVEVTTPDEFVGHIIGDLNSRSAKVQGMEPVGGRTVIRAQVAEAELYRYASTLRSITHGRAHHERSFVGYDLVPKDRAEKITSTYGNPSGRSLD